jgi:hypothetical protein
MVEKYVEQETSAKAGGKADVSLHNHRENLKSHNTKPKDLP